MQKKTLILLASLFLALVSESSSASMRCGRGLITRGDHQAEVQILCGDPTYVNARSVYRVGIPRRRIHYLNRYSSDITNRELLQHNKSVVEVPIEVWVYNFGRRLFMREVTFENGRVISIRSLGYGY